jgi:hypothetical protein
VPFKGRLFGLDEIEVVVSAAASHSRSTEERSRGLCYSNIN